VLPEGGLDRAFDRFQEVANHRRQVDDEDLREICDMAQSGCVSDA
jgi:hypothetical protein